MSAGRPTKYNKETQAKADWYIDHYKEVKDKVPTAAGLAVLLGVSKVSLYEWAKHHEKFSTTLARLNAVQEHTLTQGGLGNDYNSTIVKLMLANHGYSDKQELTHQGPGAGPVEFVLVDPKNNATTGEV